MVWLILKISLSLLGNGFRYAQGLIGAMVVILTRAVSLITLIWLSLPNIGSKVILSWKRIVGDRIK